jgi:hypothetical protein
MSAAAFSFSAQGPKRLFSHARCDRHTYQIVFLSKLVNQTLANHVVVLIIAGVVPVIQEGAKHGARLPPIVWRVQYARIAAQHVDSLVVDGRILRNKLFGDFGGDIFDRVCTSALATAAHTHGAGSRYQATLDQAAERRHAVEQMEMTAH